MDTVQVPLPSSKFEILKAQLENSISNLQHEVFGFNTIFNSVIRPTTPEPEQTNETTHDDRAFLEIWLSKQIVAIDELTRTCISIRNRNIL